VNFEVILNHNILVTSQLRELQSRNFTEHTCTKMRKKLEVHFLMLTLTMSCSS